MRTMAQEWEYFFKLWRETHADKPVLLRDLVKLAQENKLLSWILKSHSQHGNAMRLSPHLVRKPPNATSGRYKVQKDSHSKQTFFTYNL